MWPAVARKDERSLVLKTFRKRTCCWWPDACVYLTTLSHFPSHFVTWAGRPVPQQQLWPPRVSTLKDLIGLQVMVRSSTKDLKIHDQQTIQISRIQHCFRSLQDQLCEQPGRPLSNQCQPYLPSSHLSYFSHPLCVRRGRKKHVLSYIVKIIWSDTCSNTDPKHVSQLNQLSLMMHTKTCPTTPLSGKD